MPQDAFTLRYVAEELNDRLVGGKISKINQPVRDELSFLIYTKTGTIKLEISASAKNNRISLSDEEKPNPKVAPNFCMLLRKHLQNAEITAVAQVGFERVVRFDFHCFSEFSECDAQLWCEIMGKYSNLVLTRDGIILGALKTSSLGENTRRALFPGVAYVLPQPQDKTDPTRREDLEKLWAQTGGFAGDDPAKFISENLAGIAYSTATDMVAECGDRASAEQIYRYVTQKEPRPCVAVRDGEPYDFKAVGGDGEKIPYGSVLDAQKAYYAYVCKKQTFTEKKRKLDGAVAGALKKADKRLAQTDAKLCECEGADLVRLKGELLTANLYAVERGADYFEAVNYYDENGATVRIELDRKLTPAQNAQKFYKKYAKLKRTLANLTVQREETVRRKEYLEGVAANIYAAETLCDLTETEEELIRAGLIKPRDEKKKKSPPVTPYRKFTFGRFTVLSGRNNVQNDRLVKELNADDLWLHTQKYHSSHVAVLTGGNDVPEAVLKAAAEICAYYSDAREKDKVPVDYTRKKHVKKPNGSDPGFVNYTDYKTISVAPCAHTGERENHEQ